MTDGRPALPCGACGAPRPDALWGKRQGKFLRLCRPCKEVNLRQLDNVGKYLFRAYRKSVAK